MIGYALSGSVGINRLMEFATGAVCWGAGWLQLMLGAGSGMSRAFRLSPGMSRAGRVGPA